MTDQTPVPASGLDALVRRIVHETEVDDIHTHLYDPAFGSLLLWGIDDLLVYHYLVAEAFRHMDVSYETFWRLHKREQADLIWEHLFLENSPISESCRGVLTVLNLLGLDVKPRDLPSLRSWFAEQNPGDYVTRCLSVARVKSVCMTNSPFDGEERAVWEQNLPRDPRFKSGLRIDPLVLAWPSAGRELAGWGYGVQSLELNDRTLSEVRRFLAHWTRRFQAAYVMVSLPPEFCYPCGDHATQVLEGAVLPHCKEFGIPFAVMPGVRRGVNPALRLAGDGVGACNLDFLRNLCSGWPDVRFLVTALPRENQHELVVLARKFRNLHVFGCWWFTNIPCLIDEMTRLRIELLGTSFTFQHSDARVLDQVIYKWEHSRAVLSRVLVEKYRDLLAAGWELTEPEIRRDVASLSGGSFSKFCSKLSR